MRLMFFSIEREKQKGNESYRVGDINEAIMCYSRSIEMDPKNSILYANRAMGYLKIESLEKAEEDCNLALEYDCTYVKAWSRRGLTRFKRGKYSQVRVCIKRTSSKFTFDITHHIPQELKIEISPRKLPQY